MTRRFVFWSSNSIWNPRATGLSVVGLLSVTLVKQSWFKHNDSAFTKKRAETASGSTCDFPSLSSDRREVGPLHTSIVSTHLHNFPFSSIYAPPRQQSTTRIQAGQLEYVSNMSISQKIEIPACKRKIKGHFWHCRGVGLVCFFHWMSSDYY